MIPRTWTTRDRLILVLAALTALAVRLPLLPTMGLQGDMEEFAGWIHGIVSGGLPNAYDQDLTFPPVMAYVWALIGLHPAFALPGAELDAGARIAMKLPATMADFGIAAALVAWFRDRPPLAVVASAGTLLLPVTWYVSAWWGQYESIFVLWAVLALLAARGDRPHVAAALLAVSLLTKPQALPLLVPFAAWVLGRGGPRLLVSSAMVGLVVTAVAWLPFILANGPLNYLASVRAHQDETFNVLSLRAWNPWWLIQSSLAGDRFVLDGNAVLGPVTFRHLGLISGACVAAFVFIGVLRRPTVERLVVGMVVASLGAFLVLTTMHERYAYPAVVLLGLQIADRRALVAWIALAVAVSLNLLAAAPATPGLASIIRIDGPVAPAAVAVMVAVALAAASWLANERSGRSGGVHARRAPVASGT